MERPIFIVGLPRTGSTLLQNVFSRNDYLCRLLEMHFLTPLRVDFRSFLKQHVGDLEKEENIRKMTELLFVEPRIPGIKKGGFWIQEIHQVDTSSFQEKLFQAIKESDRTIGSIFKCLIEVYREMRGQQRLLVRFPVYPNYIPRLIKWYPECKVMHLIRDPRAIAISKQNDPGGVQVLMKKYPLLRNKAGSFVLRKTMVLFVIIQYNWCSRLHKRFQKYKNYSLVKYEDLLLNPKPTIIEVCKHTEIEFNEEMLVPGKGQRSSITNERKEGLDTSAAFRWMDKIGSFEKSLITILTRRSMKRFGYDPKRYLDIANKSV